MGWGGACPAGDPAPLGMAHEVFARGLGGFGGEFCDGVGGYDSADDFEVVVLAGGEIDDIAVFEAAGRAEDSEEGAIDPVGVGADDLGGHLVGKEDIGADGEEADGFEEGF